MVYEGRVMADEIDITREGDALVLRPNSPGSWANLLAATEGFDQERFDDLFPHSRQQPDDQIRPDLDDLLA